MQQSAIQHRTERNRTEGNGTDTPGYFTGNALTAFPYNVLSLCTRLEVAWHTLSPPRTHEAQYLQLTLHAGRQAAPSAVHELI
jgi:hypothetical protein